MPEEIQVHHKIFDIINVNLTYVNQLLFLPSLLTVCDIFPFVDFWGKLSFLPWSTAEDDRYQVNQQALTVHSCCYEMYWQIKSHMSGNYEFTPFISSTRVDYGRWTINIRMIEQKNDR